MNRKTTKIIAAVIVVAFAIGLIFIINSNLKDKYAEHSLSEEMFAIMFLSLDLPMTPGNEQEHYDALMKRLETMHEFDGKRFR